jgi:hypothetical protein
LLATYGFLDPTRKFLCAAFGLRGAITSYPAGSGLRFALCDIGISSGSVARACFHLVEMWDLNEYDTHSTDPPSLHRFLTRTGEL